MTRESIFQLLVDLYETLDSPRLLTYEHFRGGSFSFTQEQLDLVIGINAVTEGVESFG